MRALIIEAHLLIAMMVEDELRELGFNSFDIATTQDGAVAAARRQRPDLITASVHLAEGFGTEAVRIICNEQPIPTVYIVSNPVEVEEADSSSIVITKPIVKHALDEAVKRVTHQMNDQRLLKPPEEAGLPVFDLHARGE